MAEAIDAQRVKEYRVDDLERNLGGFDERYSMRHSRMYPHEIGHVWEAVTTSPAFDDWFMPISIVEPTLGAECSFSFGGPFEVASHGTVDEMVEGSLINYQCEFFAHRFELSEVDGDTRCDFLQVYSPDFRHEILHAEPDGEGLDLPAGVDVAWRPGMVAGYHVSLDILGYYLDQPVNFDESKDIAEETWPELIRLYRNHIRKNCPPKQ